MARHATQIDHATLDRERMVDRQIAARGVTDWRVLEAMRQVPREAFVEAGLEEFAHEDSPRPIAQQISPMFVFRTLRTSDRTRRDHLADSRAKAAS